VTLGITGLDLIDPWRYAEKGYPHEHWTRLRREAPVEYFEAEGYKGFWAITKHADICEISKQPDKFLNAPRLTIATLEDEELQRRGPPVRTIVNMDPPEHRDYRKIASSWFTPRNVRTLEERMVESARELVDKMMGDGGERELDFVTEVAALHPLRLIAHLFGVPPEDEPFVLRFTNEVFGGQDPEFQRSPDRQLATNALIAEFLAYFQRIVQDRRTSPREDLATVFANATIGGQPMGFFETLGYYGIVLTAGHETTRNALSGGMLALIESPAELEKLRRDPSLCALAADEIVRWTTPVNHFARTAACDYELRGRKIRQGDSLALFYASANRDEEVFADPFTFRVDRDPNPHLAFGIGEHFCLGAALARMEIRVLLEELAPRLEHVALAGPPERLVSSFVGGVKHLPIRYRVAPAGRA
jgi:hypothetical protein